MSEDNKSNEPIVTRPRDVALLAEIKALEEKQAQNEKPTDDDLEDKGNPATSKEDTADPFEKRFKDSQRYIQELQDKNKETLEAHTKELEAKNVALEELSKKNMELPTTPEELAEWKEKYPQMAAVIETIALEKAGDVEAEVAKTQEELKNLKAASAKELAKNTIMGTHPDFEEITKSNEFFEWVKAKPPQFNYESIVYDSADIEAINQILTQYKAEKGIKKKGRPKKSTNEAAAATSIVNTHSSTPQGNNEGKSFTESQIKAMSLEEFVKNEADIMLAQREGRMTYDLSAA